MIAAARDQEVCALQLLLGLGRQDGAEEALVVVAFFSNVEDFAVSFSAAKFPIQFLSTHSIAL